MEIEKDEQQIPKGKPDLNAWLTRFKIYINSRNLMTRWTLMYIVPGNESNH